MYWKIVPSQWWKVSSLIILGLIPLSCNLGINIDDKQDLVQDIKLGEGKDWATGFLLPPGAQNGQGAIKDSPLFIYDFKPNFDVTKNNKSFMVSLSFHEYYFRCKIFVCNKVEDVISPYNVLNTRLYAHRIDVHPFDKHCLLIDPILHGPVYRRNGPFFVEVLCDSQLGYIPERHHLLQERGGLLYNFTYEINVINSVPVKHHVVDFTSEQKKQLCNNNGYLILQETETSQFEFSCKCLLGTSGPTCRWGPQCPASDDRSMCNNRGFCWSRPMENSHGCICDKEYIGPACNHFTAFYNLDGYHNLIECPRNDSCHSCYILPSRIEKCSCRIGYKLSPSGLCVNDSLIVILRYETHNKSSLTKLDVATKIKSLFPCSKEFQLPNLVNQISIDESSNIVKLHDVSKVLFPVVRNASLWSEVLAANCTHNNSSFKSLSSWDTKETSSSDVRICLSLVRIQYAETVIEMFRNSFVNSTLKKICCHTSSNHFAITFYKENKIINEPPFNLSKIKNMSWQSGDLRMEPHEKGVCLVFNKASAIDDGVYICKAEDQFHTEEKELYVKQSKPKLSVDVGPEKVSVLQGGNITVNCSVKNKSYYTFHPRLSFYTDLPNSNASNYPLKTRTISLPLVNVTRNVIVTCNVSDVYNVEKYYTEKNITVEVVYPNQPYCSFNSSYGIDWQPQKISSTTEMKCPKGYSGYCTRDCTIGRDLIYAFWELPDCSQCERKEITEFVKNVSLYSRGIKSYLPNPNLLFKTMKNILSKTTEFLPGEMSSVIRVLNFILSSLPVNLEFDDFYSMLDFIMSKDNFILEKDFENLETLMNRFPLKFLKGDYAARYINKDTLTGYLSVPFVHEFPYKIVFPSDDISYKKRSVSFTHTRQQRTVHPKTSVLIYDERRKATIISIIIFKKAHLFFKHRKKIVQRKAISKSLDDEILDEHFGKLSSPLVQARLFNEHQMVNDDTEKITVIFEPCTPQSGTDIFSSISSTTLRCGKYIPKKRIWNTTGCSFNNSEESCSCTCVGIDGWIGLVDSNTSRHTEILLSQNFVAAVGCMISAMTLTLTIIVLMIRCGFWSTRLLTKVIECIALLVANVVFFSCSIVKTENTDQMTLLIIISGSLVMALSMSICHQIDILSKYHEYRVGPLRKLEIADPSFLLTFACVLISALLGAILWTIGRVKSIKPSNAWLPENDEASGLSLVVVCCFSILLLLICIMASISWLKLNRLNVLFPSTGTEILFKELKSTSFLTVIKIFYISTSIYQDKEVGKYIFLLASILLGTCYLILYTCENLRSGDSSPSTSHSELQANERSKRKLCDLKTCLWRWLCSASVIYSGVAGTEVSPLPNEDSIEFRKRNESLHSPNLSAKNEENDNCLKSSLDIESHISNNWGLSEGSLKNKETHCTCLSEKNLPFGNSGNVVVSIERLCLNNVRSDTSALKTPNSGITSNHIRDLKDQGNRHKITEGYLCMNGKRAKLEVQNSRYLPMNGPHVKDIEIPIFYENVSDNSEGGEVRTYFKYDSKNCNSEKVQSVNHSNSVSKNIDRANNDSLMIMYNTNTTNSSTLPFSDKRKNLFSNFSSKFSILGSKTKRIHKNLSSGRIAMSTSNGERNILINGDQRVFYKDTDSKPNGKEYYLGHRRQHSF